jgi:hypothetical protein
VRAEAGETLNCDTPPRWRRLNVKELTTADLVYVYTIKVVPISLTQSFKALSDINKAKLADKLCKLLL